MSARILIVEDDPAGRTWLEVGLKKEGFVCFSVSSGEECLNFLEKEVVDVVITDIRMSGMSGIDLLEKIKDKWDIPVILITAYGDVNTVIESLRKGASDFILKPFSYDLLLSRINHLISYKKVKEENIYLKEHRGKIEFVGKSEGIKNILKLANKVAKSDSTVLITGESGTGKEMLARYIHENSLRKTKPFVAINCSAMPETLLESELFGYKKGAFTGAYKDRMGLFRIADGGTILLDEIGDMPMHLQSKLLRVLQTHEITPLGSDSSVSVDVRVIAATNKDLREEMEKGTFRQDLYYRLNVVELHLPPLRERLSDIPELVEYFIDKYSMLEGKNVEVTDDIMKIFMSYHWPGNVRELENIIERLVVLSEDGKLDISLLPENMISTGSKGKLLEIMEIELIKKVLRDTGGNKTQTAHILGIDVATLYRKIKKYKIEV